MSEFEILTIEQVDREFALSVIVAIVSFLSAILVYIDYKNRRKKDKAEKSIEIAKDFALNIVDPLTIIHSFFKQFNINPIIYKVNFMMLEDFDIEELKELYSDEDIKNYNEIIKQNTTDDFDIKEVIRDTLNTLEYHCMYIATKVADDKYIYNSLHQQFLKSIALLYFEISLINIDNKDKYYTNIIHVYNLWKNKYIKSIQREDKIMKKQAKLNNKQKKLKKKLQLPAPKI